MIPKTNEVYRHFKGNLYKVLTIAKHSETGEELVIYQGMYEDNPVFARPLTEFVSDVDKVKYPEVTQKKRFELIPEQKEAALDPLVEQYLDADTCHERINILHGLQHRITEQMLATMAVVIDFELPEGDVKAKYKALDECLKMKEKYETKRME